MGLSAAAIQKLAEFGLTLEQVVEVAAAMEQGQGTRSAAAERQARYRARRAETVTRDVTRDVTASSSAPSEVSPQTPLPNTPTTHKEKTPKGVQKKGSRLPSNWVLPEDWRQDAERAGLPPQQIDAEAERMRDWSLSSPAGAKLDWRAAWRNWCKSAAERQPMARGSPPRQPTLSAAFGQLARSLEPQHDEAHHPEPARIAVLDLPFRPGR